MRPNSPFWLACCLTLFLSVAPGSRGQAVTLSDSTAESEAAELKKFEAWAKGFADKPHTDILLPDAEKWFAEHFEAELAKKLTHEYLERARGVAGLPLFFQNAKSKGKTEVHVSSTSKAIDMSANGLQNAALQRTKNKLTLLTLRMIAPGEEAGSSLWSFIELDGKYRFVGKMTVLNPTNGDLATDVLCQMPLGETEKLLQGNGLIKKSAVEYLQEKGVLK